MPLTREQFDQTGLKLVSREGSNFLAGGTYQNASRFPRSLDDQTLQYLSSIGVTPTQLTKTQIGDPTRNEFTWLDPSGQGINTDWNTSGGTTFNMAGLDNAYTQYTAQQQQQAEATRNSQLNAFIDQYRGTNTTINIPSNLDPSGQYTIYKGTFVQKSSVPNLANSVNDGSGNLINQGPTPAGQVNVGTQAAPLYVPAGSAGAQLSAGLANGTVSPTNPQQQMAASMTGNNVNDPGIVPYAPGEPPAGSKYEGAFNRAMAAGADKMAGDSNGMSVVSQYAPQRPNGAASSFAQSDPYIQGLVTAFQQYISPQNQRISLTETYNRMLQSSGIQALDTQLLNMKNVMEGTEDDLRTEVTKAGGFATESQILALTNARNKQLIKNYNMLLETRNSKEKYIQTAMQLEEADRKSADQRFEQAFSMGTQLHQLHQQMQQNSRSQFQWLVGQVGFGGLYGSLNGDPHAIALAEQSLGLPSGGLLQSVGSDPNSVITRDGANNFFLNGKPMNLATFQSLGINADFVPAGSTISLSQATTGQQSAPDMKGYTSDMKEYEYAKQQGFTGSFQQWVDRSSGTRRRGGGGGGGGTKETFKRFGTIPDNDLTNLVNDINAAIKDTSAYPNREALIAAIQNNNPQYKPDDIARLVYERWGNDLAR